MRSSDTLGKIAPALVKALNEVGGVGKAAANPFFKSKYATLENVIDASKPFLAANGIVLIQFPGAYNQGAMSLETVLMHESGEWISGSEAFGVATGKQDPQAVGSALTYARRYAHMAVLNMPAVDDDGEGAMPRNQVQAKITQDQADTLEALIQDVGADRGRFLDYFKVSALQLILASDYGRAVDALEAKRAK